MHHRTLDFPLTPEAAQLTEDMPSLFMHELYNKLVTELFPNKITAHTRTKSSPLTRDYFLKQTNTTMASTLSYYNFILNKVYKSKNHNVARFTQSHFSGHALNSTIGTKLM